jgi:hypothetical protein
MPKRNATRKRLRLITWLYLAFGWIFIKKPTKLLWTLSDFKAGRRWAMTVPHPHIRNKSLWDYVCAEGDSVLILHKLNQYI